MARAQILCKRWCAKQHVFSFRVDELVVRVAKSQAPKFIGTVERVTYADLADILPQGRQRVLQTPNASKAVVFRTRFVADPQPPAGELVLRDATAPAAGSDLGRAPRAPGGPGHVPGGDIGARPVRRLAGSRRPRGHW